MNETTLTAESLQTIDRLFALVPRAAQQIRSSDEGMAGYIEGLNETFADEKIQAVIAECENNIDNDTYPLRALIGANQIVTQLVFAFTGNNASYQAEIKLANETRDLTMIIAAAMLPEKRGE